MAIWVTSGLTLRLPASSLTLTSNLKPAPVCIVENQTLLHAILWWNRPRLLPFYIGCLMPFVYSKFQYDNQQREKNHAHNYTDAEENNDQSTCARCWHLARLEFAMLGTWIWSRVMVLDLSNVTSDGRTEYCRAPYTLPRLSKGRMMVINLWSLGWDLSMKECKLVMFSRRFAFKHGIMIPPFPWMYWWVTYELCKFVSQSLTIMVEFMNHWCKTLIF